MAEAGAYGRAMAEAKIWAEEMVPVVRFTELKAVKVLGPSGAELEERARLQALKYEITRSRK